MDYQFTEDQCCVNCQKALNSLNKWFYLDNYGNQQGPFDSFLILYYIHFGYFEEDSVFFIYDKFSGNPSNYNTLLNYLDSIVQDVKNHAPSLFSCPHLMENFSSTQEFSPMSDVQLPEGVSNFREAKDVFVSTENMYASSNPPVSREFPSRDKTTPDSPEELRSMASRTLLKKRVESNLKEADAHLMRVNSRKVSHVLEKSLSRD